MLSKKLKNFVWKVGEKVRVPFYTKKQQYRFFYEVELKNNSMKSKVLELVVPVPLNTDMQILLSKPFFEPADALFQQDENFGNSYALWKVQIEPQASRRFRQTFNVEVSPALMKTRNSYSFSDYRSLSNEIRNKFMTSNRFVKNDDLDISKLAKDLKGLSDDVIETARKFNDFVVSYLDYKNPILGLYTAQEAFRKKEVDCGGFDTLFVSMCLSVGIPARVVSGFWAGYQKNDMHAWAEFLLPDGQWMPVDPSMDQLFEKGKTRKSGRFGNVGSDRVIFSVGCDLLVEAAGHKNPIDILQNPLLFPHENAQDVEVILRCRTEKLSLKKP